MRNDERSWGAGTAPPALSFLIRVVLCLPLVAVSLVFITIAIIGVAKLPAADLAALPNDYARAAMTALVCLVLAIPAAACRPSLIWVVPLGAGVAVGAAGWSLLPLPAGPWEQVLEGAVLLLPVMVLVLGFWWARIPEGIADTVAAMGGSPGRIFFDAVIEPAVPGVARGLALVFVLALGLAPLLAPAPGSP